MLKNNLLEAIFVSIQINDKKKKRVKWNERIRQIKKYSRTKIAMNTQINNTVTGQSNHIFLKKKT